MSNDAMTTVRRFWEEMWSGGDAALVFELFDREARENGETLDLERFSAAVASLTRIFPDFVATIEDLVDLGDGRVLSRVTYTGTQHAPWAGLPATGRSFRSVGIDIFHVENGRITELWHSADHYDMAVQLGGMLAPRPDAGAVEPSA